MADAFLVVAGISAVGGCVALRRAWSLPRRSPQWNATGWGLFAVAAVLGWLGAGAWGVSVAGLCGMGAALVLLAYAAATAPAVDRARASNRRAGALPAAGEPWRVGRRIATFAIVVLVAAIVSIGLGLAARAILGWAGAGEANAITMGFFTMPLAWALLVFAVMLEERRARQWRLLALASVPGVLAVAGGLAT